LLSKQKKNARSWATKYVHIIYTYADKGPTLSVDTSGQLASTEAVQWRMSRSY